VQPVPCVSLAQPTVVPAKFVVPHGREVAFAQRSLAGGAVHDLEMVKVPVVDPEEQYAI